MKNKIYKIFTVVVMLSLMFSLVCVNASAFERENSFIDCPGDSDDFGVTAAPYAIYGPDYVLIPLGDIGSISSGVSTPNYFCELTVLNYFLGANARGNVVSPSGLYSSSDYEKLRYLEFFYDDLSSSTSLKSLGIYPVGIESDLIFYSGHVYVRENEPGLSYSCNFSYSFVDSSYFSDFHYRLFVACYFDDYNPYDTTEAPELVDSIWDLEQRLDYLDDGYNSLYVRFEDLQYHNQQLELNYHNLINDFETLDYLYEKLKFEQKNVDVLDKVFTGTAQGFVTIIQGVSGLGYTVGGVDVTVGGLLVVSLLAAVFVFIIRFFFGGNK